ncbi:MAG: beta-propeller repeat, partial [Chthonomonadaceae bacterium]|nr:beta-propeller repeat [Chthonomonadaceae bacterium]
MTIRLTRNMVSVPMLALLAASGGGQVQAQTPPPYLHAPSVTDYATHNPDGRTILPTGRYIQPVGKHLPLARWPHGMVLSPDGKTAFVASEGVGQFITDFNNPEPTVISFSPGEAKRRSNAGGAVFSPDGKTLYWSSGESGEIHIVNVSDHTVTGNIEINVEIGGRKFEDSFAMDIQASPDGSTLYVADVTNFRVITIDTAQSKVVGSVDVGRYPYALAVAGKKVYVANIGLFAYSAIPKPTLPAKSGETIDPRGLTFPPFAFPSKEARDGVEVEGRKVPGLGDPNVPESFSVWGIDVADPAAPKVIARLKTGLLLGAPADN